MTQFHDLVQDVIFCIIDMLPPDDLVNTALTCKHLHALAAHALKKHTALLEKYSHIVCVPSYSPAYLQFGSSICPAILLRDLIENKHIQFYPRKMTIAHYAHHRHLTPDFPPPNVTGILRGLDDAVQTKISLSKYWYPDIAQIFASTAFDGDKLNLIVSILIPLFFRLRHMTLFDPASRDNNTQTIASIARKTWRLKRKRPAHALNELTTLEVVASDNSGGLDDELSKILTMLPSLRVIKGHNIRAFLTRTSNMKRPMTGPLPEIDTIEFSKCMLHSHNLIQFIERTKSLRNFKYEHDHLLGLYGGFKMADIIEALLDCANQTLTCLDLTNRQFSVIARDDPSCRIWPLHGFQVLHTIRINLEMFPTEYAIEEDAGLEALPPCDDYLHPNLYRLVDVLPPCIETLVLVAQGRREPEAAMRLVLQGLPELRHERLPNLRRIICEGYQSMGEEWIAMCRYLGIDVFGWDSIESRTLVLLSEFRYA